MRARTFQWIVSVAWICWFENVWKFERVSTHDSSNVNIYHIDLCVYVRSSHKCVTVHNRCATYLIHLQSSSCTVATSHQRHIERNISRRKHIRTNRTCAIKSNAYVMATLRKSGFSVTTVCRVAVSLVVFFLHVCHCKKWQTHPSRRAHKDTDFFFFSLARKKRNVCTQIDNFRVELPLALLQCAILPLT